jgi:hypothetical protein
VTETDQSSESPPYLLTVLRMKLLQRNSNSKRRSLEGEGWVAVRSEPVMKKGSCSLVEVRVGGRKVAEDEVS